MAGFNWNQLRYDVGIHPEPRVARSANMAWMVWAVAGLFIGIIMGVIIMVI